MSIRILRLVVAIYFSRLRSGELRGDLRLVDRSTTSSGLVGRVGPVFAVKYGQVSLTSVGKV